MPAIAGGNSKFVAPLLIAFGVLSFTYVPFQWILPLSYKQETCFLYAVIIICQCNIDSLCVPRMSPNCFQELMNDKSRACENINMVEFIDDMALGNYAEVSLKKSHIKCRVYLSKDLSERALLKLQNYQILTFSSYRCI